jgi:tRNA dimethylallyltransferase
VTLPPLVVIAGPTATGKTTLAIEVAEAIERTGRPAEIVSADSRQVYRGLDIGTAKASAEERARVVHHGIDLVEPDEPFSVADFRRHALDALERLGERGGVAILAGGTGFWIRAVARGIDTDALPSDPAARVAIEERLADRGLDALRDDPGLRAGLNVAGGEVTHAAVASGVGAEYVPPEQALAG